MHILLLFLNYNTPRVVRISQIKDQLYGDFSLDNPDTPRCVIQNENPYNMHLCDLNTVNKYVFSGKYIQYVHPILTPALKGYILCRYVQVLICHTAHL